MNESGVVFIICFLAFCVVYTVKDIFWGVTATPAHACVEGAQR